VVEGDQDPVGGEVYVGLQVAVPEVDGVLERGQRVLRGLRRATAVSEGDRARMIEERERHGDDGSVGQWSVWRHLRRRNGGFVPPPSAVRSWQPCPCS